MSNDNQYYFFDDEPGDEPAIPAAEGWKQMHQLLDEHMPVSSDKRIKKYFFFVVFAFVVSAGILFSFQLKNSVVHDTIIANANTPGNTNANAGTLSDNAGAVDLNILKNETTATIAKDKPYENTLKENFHFENAIDKKESFLNTNDNSRVQNLTNSVVNVEENKNQLNENEQSNVSLNNAALSKTNNNDSVSKAAVRKKTDPQNKHALQFDLGVTTNFALNAQRQDLQPYPLVNAKYSLNKRFYVSAGLATFSPVTSDANAITKTSYQPGISSLSLFDTRKNYYRQYYIDVPVTAGININRHISFDAGIQFSKSLVSKSNSIVEPYDYHENRLNLSGGGIVFNSGATRDVNYQSELRSIDARYIAGVHYQLNKFSIGLQYQQGIKPLLKGDAVTGDRSKILSLKISYKLK